MAKINNSKTNTSETVASIASNAWAGCRTYAHSEEDELLDLDKVTDTGTQADANPKFTTTGVILPDLREKLTDLEERVNVMEVKLDILQSLFNTVAVALEDEDIIKDRGFEEGAEEDTEDDDLDESDKEVEECNSDHDGDSLEESESEEEESDDDESEEEDACFKEYQEYMREKRLREEKEKEKEKKKKKDKPSKEDRYYMRKIFDKIRQLPGFEDTDPSVLDDEDSFRELLLKTAPLVALINTMTKDGPFYYQGCIFSNDNDDEEE